jgi:superfamily II DNA or RNA helicase
MTEIVKLASNAVVAKLIDASKTTRQIVRELLSYQVEGAEFMHGFGSGSWDGRSTFYTSTNDTFPAGFVHMVHHELQRRGIRVMLVRKPLPAPLGPENPIVDEHGNDNPKYDYQPKALAQVLRHGRGIIQVATGGGKSKIAKLIVARIRRMTMFITTRGVLMYQMKQGFEDAGFRCGIIGDGEWAPTRGVNVGMVQTLVAQLEETTVEKEVEKILARMLKAEEKEVDELKASLIEAKRPVPEIHKAIDKLIKEQEGRRPKAEDVHAKAEAAAKRQMENRARLIKLLEMVEVVIGEEAHEASGNSYYEILRHCKNAHYRIALTATPFMRQDAESNLRLMAAFGPVLIKVTEKMLIDRGVLATPIFAYATPAVHPKVKKSTPWQRAYKFGIVESEARNAIIIEDCVKAKAHGLPAMVLVTHKAHGKVIREGLVARGIRARFIQGESDQATRQKALNELGAGKIDVLIGTTILDVGVDVPSVGYVGLAGGGKAEIALRQRIGRGLRAKKKGPNYAFIRDFADPLNAHLKEHYRTRRAIVEETEGFGERILPANDDFPWHLFDQDSIAA